MQRKPTAYQFVFEEMPVVYLRATLDRSGHKCPAIDSDDNSGTPIPASLRWHDAPEGMEYHEESPGAWHGRKILLTTYHVRNLDGNGELSDEWMDYLLSIQDEEGVFRPFLYAIKTFDTVGSMGLGVLILPSGQIIGAQGCWNYIGTGSAWVEVDFVFRSDGPHLTRTCQGGRRQPTVTKTYNAAGKVVRTRSWNGEEQHDP